jgi:hypothetical protein
VSERAPRCLELHEQDLRSNKLTAVPEVIRGLEGLEKLDLRWNQVGPLPDWLRRREQDGCTVYC